MIGKVIEGKYTILSELGSGGMGKVYKAQDLLLGRFLAIKVLHQGQDTSKDRADLIKEAKNLSRVKSEHIVEVLAVGTLDDNSLYLVMEYIEGNDLESIITRDGALGEERTTRIASQICSAIACAHQSKIIHRDLKSANVMISESEGKEKAKVLDFGLSKNVGPSTNPAQQATKTGALIGSIGYMAPEICAGKRATFQSDIYSLGCIMYECLSGQLPFVSDNWVALLYMHRNQLPRPLKELNPEISDELERIVFKCIQKDESDRFASADAVLRALEMLQSGNLSELTLSGVKISNEEKTHSTGAAKFIVLMLLVTALATAAIIGASRLSIKNAHPVVISKPKSAAHAQQKVLSFEHQIRQLVNSCESIQSKNSSVEERKAFIQKAEEVINQCIKQNKRPEYLCLIYQMKGRQESFSELTKDSLLSHEKALHYAELSKDGRDSDEAEYALIGILNASLGMDNYKQQEQYANRLLALAKMEQRPSILSRLGFSINPHVVDFGNDSDYYVAYLALARLNMSKKHWAKAIEYGKLAQSNKATLDDAATCVVAECYFNSGQRKKAEYELEKFSKMLFELSGEFEKESQSSYAGVPLSNSQLLEKSAPNVLPFYCYHLGNFYLFHGYASKAKPLFKEAIALANLSNNPQALRYAEASRKLLSTLK